MPNNTPKYWQVSLFLIFFVWISFFPFPLVDRYGWYIKIAFGAILLFINFFNKVQNPLIEARDWSLWLFLFVILLNIINAVNKSLALSAYLNIALASLVAFYIGKFVFASLQNRVFLCLVISVCAFIVATFGLFEFIFGKNILYVKFIPNSYYERYSVYFPRPMSTQFNPVILGSFLIGCLPFSFIFCESKIKLHRIFGTIAVIVSVSTILLTASRGVFLGFAALCGFYLWKSGKGKLIFAYILLLLTFALFCSSSANKNLRQIGFDKILYGTFDSSISSYRVDRASMAMRMASEHPISGVGLKHFRFLFNKYSKYGDGSIEPYELMIPDNMYLSLLSETGFLGLLAFLTFIFLLVKGGIQRFNAEQDRQVKLTILMPLCALIGLLVNMGAYDLFYWDNPLMLFSLICGFITAI